MILILLLCECVNASVVSKQSIHFGQIKISFMILGDWASLFLNQQIKKQGEIERSISYSKVGYLILSISPWGGGRLKNPCE